MPRAHRYYVQGHVWHITHRCHSRAFLLRHRRDRQRWRFWAVQARRRYGFRVLNYIVTCNHVHLLIYDRGQGEIAKAMQLVAGRTAQEYNRRKGRVGAYWQDRYHATAVETDQHLVACMHYIDLNMVRAGAVTHPREWRESGYCEIQQPRQRYRLIDLAALTQLLECPDLAVLQQRLREGAERALTSGPRRRQSLWSESVAVGSRGFVERVRGEMGARVYARRIEHTEGAHVLRDCD